MKTINELQRAENYCDNNGFEYERAGFEVIKVSESVYDEIICQFDLIIDRVEDNYFYLTF